MLTGGERRVLSALVETMFPAIGDKMVSGLDAGVAESVESHLASMPRGTWRQFRALFLAVQLSPLLSLRFHRFTSLGPAARAAVLTDWEQSRIYARRMALFFIKYILGGAYTECPAVRRALGFTAVSAAADAL